MNLQPIKFHRCALDQGQGVLLVDVESECVPRKDFAGNLQYYCLTGGHVFSVDENDQVIIYYCNEHPSLSRKRL